MPLSATTERRRLIAVIAILTALFAFRLLYGLSSEFFFDDEAQIFLMGLRYYATGHWPYFGPDIVWSKSEIPGALQALLVGIPLRIAPVPEAPYVFLNLLSMAALVAFAWYILARLPQLPGWLVLAWLATLPWTLEYSTHIINPSYVLAPSLVFFMAFFEAAPVFRIGRIPEPFAFALMGAAVVWIQQVHSSWPLLLPYVAFAWISAGRRGVRAVAVNTLGLLTGVLLLGVLLVPTFVAYGTQAGTGRMSENLRPHWVNPWIAVTTTARIFSFASYEIWRFLATDNGKRQMLLLDHLWIVPPAVVVWLAGLWQPIWMLREWFRTESPFKEWRALKWLVVATVLIVYAAYWFVLEPAQAHSFYVTAPVAFMFAAYCWTFVDSPRWRRIAGAILTVNILFHVGQAWIQAPQKSLYRNREVVAAAIRSKEPEMFAHRRAFAIDAGPVRLQASSRPYDLRKDVQFSDVHFTLGLRRVALWRLTLTNTNQRVAYRNVLYMAHYRDAAGRGVDERIDYIKNIFQPGAVVTLDLNDGIVTAPFASATIEVVDADAVLPMK